MASNSRCGCCRSRFTRKNTGQAENPVRLGISGFSPYRTTSQTKLPDRKGQSEFIRMKLVPERIAWPTSRCNSEIRPKSWSEILKTLKTARFWNFCLQKFVGTFLGLLLCFAKLFGYIFSSFLDDFKCFIRKFSGVFVNFPRYFVEKRSQKAMVVYATARFKTP